VVARHGAGAPFFNDTKDIGALKYYDKLLC